MDPPEILLPATPCLLGSGVCELTPPQQNGWNLAGHSANGQRATSSPPSTGDGHDRTRHGLFATALVVAPRGAAPDPAQTLVLVACDLHSISGYVFGKVTSALSPIPASNIIINATHTHSGFGQFYSSYDDAEKSRPGTTFYDRMTVANHFLGFDQTHADRVVGGILDAVRSALRDLPEGFFSVSSGFTRGFFSNRSLSAKARNDDFGAWSPQHAEGVTSANTNTKNKHAETLSPYDRHVDPRIRLFLGVPAAGGEVAALASVGCHPTSLGNSVSHYSPDWVGPAKIAAGKAVAEGTGKKMPAIAILQSCAGDISPLPISGPLAATEERGPGRRPATQGTDLQECVGTGIGDAVGEMIEFAKKSGEAAEVEAEEEAGGRKRKGKAAKAATPRKKKGSASATDAPFIQSATSIWRPTNSAATPTLPVMGLPTLGGAACGPTDHLYPRLGLGLPSNTLPSSDPQHPKTPIPGLRLALQTILPGPSALPLTVVVLGGRMIIATVPGEPTCTVGSRIEARLISEVLNDAPGASCLVLGFCGEYAGYWVTPEEYDEQLYEGSSQMWGRGAADAMGDELVALGLEAVGKKTSKPRN
ncbi:hypothetical protein TeGR_g7157 [Tetraparma gracilis]|uniref:Neutral ceramidase n=1 Tax=Tetraparma gracilis TaxID=2962635 RepID=A0ABQ6NAR4_9STRA|nr:hypothetical protein TeGR_g7157 [Tetraparma gracilis]